MAIDTSIPRTRRALLAAAIGAGAATVASALGRPLPVSAGSDGDVVLGDGNTARTTTAVSNFTTTDTAFAANCSLGDALRGTTSGAGKSGVYGVSNVASGYGVHGRCDAGNGVYGGSDSGNGVVGTSIRSCGVLGIGDSGPGVYGTSISGEGVFGYAIGTAAAWGVHGQSTIGRGVYGQATSGVGLYGYATTGYALRANGRVKLDKCAGVATIAAGSDRVTVTPGINLVSTSAVVATPQGNAGATSTSVSRCIANATTDTFTIILTRAATANVKVAWIVLG